MSHLDAQRDDALSDEDVVDRPSTANAADAETENVSAPDINEIIRESCAANRTRSVAPASDQSYSGVIKPLIAVVTAQYVIVAALVAGVAVTVAHHASQVDQ